MEYVIRKRKSAYSLVSPTSINATDLKIVIRTKDGKIRLISLFRHNYKMINGVFTNAFENRLHEGFCEKTQIDLINQHSDISIKRFEYYLKSNHYAIVKLDTDEVTKIIEEKEASDYVIKLHESVITPKTDDTLEVDVTGINTNSEQSKALGVDNSTYYVGSTDIRKAFYGNSILLGRGNVEGIDLYFEHSKNGIDYYSTRICVTRSRISCGVNTIHGIDSLYDLIERLNVTKEAAEEAVGNMILECFNLANVNTFVMSTTASTWKNISHLFNNNACKEKFQTITKYAYNNNSGNRIATTILTR